MSKSNKELAIEATIEIIKSWNSRQNTAPMDGTHFSETLKTVHSAICDLDKDYSL